MLQTSASGGIADDTLTCRWLNQLRMMWWTTPAPGIECAKG
jgi:hypothetical protein